MGTLKTIYQHRTPQREQDHEIEATMIERVSPFSRQVEFIDVCGSCGQSIVRVDENEGPERRASPG